MAVSWLSAAKITSKLLSQQNMPHTTSYIFTYLSHVDGDSNILLRFLGNKQQREREVGGGGRKHFELNKQMQSVGWLGCVCRGGGGVSFSLSFGIWEIY